MNKISMPFDFATKSRQQFVADTAKADLDKARIRKQIGEDNQRNLKTNWFSNSLKPGFRGLGG
jgi:hypothetical protein